MKVHAGKETEKHALDRAEAVTGTTPVFMAVSEILVEEKTQP